MSSIRKLLETTTLHQRAIPGNPWVRFDLTKDEHNDQPRFADEQWYVMSLKISRKFKSPESMMYAAVPHVEKEIVHRLFGGALALVSSLELALTQGDKVAAFDLLSELKKEMML